MSNGKRHEGSELRYKQLLELAQEGNEEAAGDLFREYGVQFLGQTLPGDRTVAS